jgi:hypothetical protein
MNTQVLVCRTAWMDFYRGTKGDKATGGGAYVKEVGFGHEVFNFLQGHDGAFRGYVRPPSPGWIRDQRINIVRLGASKDDDRVEDVTVFWVATHPTSETGNRLQRNASSRTGRMRDS